MKERKKELYELKLGQMTMEDLINKFLDLLRFVPYIKEEKVKVRQFLSCLPQPYKNYIEFYNPKTLDEVLRKERICFEQYKQRNDISKVWNDKKEEKFSQQKKGFRPPPFRNIPRNSQGNTYNINEKVQLRGIKPTNVKFEGDVQTAE